MALEGKVFAVTGGSSGIGLATSKILSERGATVCICDVNDKTLGEADVFFKEKGVKYSTTKVDVAKRGDVDAWIEGITSQFGRLDGAANIAGVMPKGFVSVPVVEQDDDDWHRIIGVNLTGMFYCLRAELKHISDGGSIVNMSSIQGLHGHPNGGAYGASKHGVIGLTESAAKENGARNVRVNAVAPGAIYTPLMQAAFDVIGRPADAPFSEPTAIQRQGKAEEVANVVAFLLGPDSTFVTGSTYTVDGGWLHT